MSHPNGFHGFVTLMDIFTVLLCVYRAQSSCPGTRRHWRVLLIHGPLQELCCTNQGSHI